MAGLDLIRFSRKAQIVLMHRVESLKLLCIPSALRSKAISLWNFCILTSRDSRKFFHVTGDTSIQIWSSVRARNFICRVETWRLWWGKSWWGKFERGLGTGPSVCRFCNEMLHSSIVCVFLKSMWCLPKRPDWGESLCSLTVMTKWFQLFLRDAYCCAENYCFVHLLRNLNAMLFILQYCLTASCKIAVSTLHSFGNAVFVCNLLRLCWLDGTNHFRN